MNQINELNKTQELKPSASPMGKWKAFLISVFLTVVYANCFKISGIVALMSGMVFDSPSMNPVLGYSFIAVCMSVPLILLYTIFKTWYNFFKRRYEKIIPLILLPLIVFFVALGFAKVFDYLNFF
jgi:hypothetical protein